MKTRLSLFVMLAVALSLFSGCTCAVMRATYHPREVRPSKIPPKRLCVSTIDYLSPNLELDLNVLNKTLNKYYPSVFAKIPTETCQHVGVYYDCALTRENYLTNGFTYLTFLGSAFILPRVDSFEYTHKVNLTLKDKGANKVASKTIVSTSNYTQHYGWFFSNWIFLTRNNFGRYWRFNREALGCI